MGLPKYSQHAHNYKMKIVNENNADASTIVTLTRESRNKKISYQNAQAEEAKEIVYIK